MQSIARKTPQQKTKLTDEVDTMQKTEFDKEAHVGCRAEDYYNGWCFQCCDETKACFLGMSFACALYTA